ncbi:MAG: hypothetical protein ACQEQK_03270 [Thermodesulfobacteriota bacterium]
MKKTNLRVMLALVATLLLLVPSSVLAFQVGDLTIGGAIRANYTIGDYAPEVDEGPSRAEDDGGSFSLDIFRVNLDYERGNWVAKAEYRFYPGYGGNNHDSYNMMHTGWIGYNFNDGSQVQVGVNRVPFGPGAYGVSQSWMFDQHYYIGLADDMDLGVKYSKSIDNLALDFAYYAMDEGNWFGSSEDSTRYSYDVVNESGDGYEEEHQFNVRAIYTISSGDITTDLGASLQYGLLDSNGSQDDGDHFAGSVHAVTSMGNLTIAPQLTYYSYDVDKEQALGTDKLVQFGAFDFPTTVAAEAWVPAISVSYKIETPQLDWLSYVLPYVEYSSIMKEESNFNDSDMFVVGAAWANGGWYIYTDLAYSNGNDFVGNESGWDRYGANADDEWEYRGNINFGYYF